MIQRSLEQNLLYVSEKIQLIFNNQIILENKKKPQKFIFQGFNFLLFLQSLTDYNSFFRPQILISTTRYARFY
jgi:hypothetical protein